MRTVRGRDDLERAIGKLHRADHGLAEPRAKCDAYMKEVLPLLRENGLRCHGEKKKKGGLDLRSADSILRGGESGEALMPGKPDESRLMEKIRSGRMPPCPPRAHLARRCAAGLAGSAAPPACR